MKNQQKDLAAWIEPLSLCAENQIILKDGTREKCESWKTASSDHKTCVDPECEFNFKKLIDGSCERCPLYQRASSSPDHKTCAEPECAKDLVIGTDGICKACLPT